MNRLRFLSNVRHSIQTGYLPMAQSQAIPGPTISPFDPYDLVEQFIEQALAVKCEVHEVTSHAGGCQRVSDIFSRHKATSYIAWKDEFLPIHGLKADLVERGFQCHDSAIPNEPADRREAHLALSDIPIGLTGAMAGLADTGSVVVSCGEGRGRLASLLPPIHIALVETHLLYPSIAGFVEAHSDVAKLSSNLVFITGPSRSGDIEQTLTLGVHGPKELHVILITLDHNEMKV